MDVVIQETKKRPRPECFVSHTVEELIEWMAARQSDMRVAVEAGNAPEVSRLAVLLAKGSAQLKSSTLNPSMASNSDMSSVKVSRWRSVSARYGLRGVRIGEASHPGPPVLRRLRRRRSVPVEISSDEEPLMRYITRNVFPQVDGVETERDASQSEISETVPASQTALHEAGRQSPCEVPAHVLDALEEDLDRVDDVPPTVPAFSGAIEDTLQRRCAEPLATTQWDTVTENSVEGQNVIVERANSMACHDAVQCDKVAHVVDDRQPMRLTLVSSQATSVAEEFRLDTPSESRTLRRDRSSSVAPGDNSGDEVDELVSSATSDTVSLFGGSDVSGEEVLESVPEVAVEVPVLRAIGLQLREAWPMMDAVDLPLMFQHRPEVMRSVPHFLQGPFRNALLMALEEACHPERLRRERGWKLLMLLPRLLFHKRPRGGIVPKHKLVTRFEQFAQGQLGSLIRDSTEACEIASRNRARGSRRPVDDVTKRAERAQTLLMMGEVFAGRRRGCIGTRQHHDFASVEQPVQPIRELPREFREFQPAVPFMLDEQRFAQNVRSARRGAAPGPSGMTNEHFRILLSNPSHFQWLFRAGEQLARGDIPAVVVDVVRLGRMTALHKPDGGVRGIVVGDVLRRLVGRTIAQQLMPAVERYTAPFQYALKTRAGTECVAHVLQALTEADPTATVLSIDGISAYDLISRRAMLEALRRVPGGDQVLPFVRLFYDRQSTYLWEDDAGTVHHIVQGEGGEQGDPLMPLLFRLGAAWSVAGSPTHPRTHRAIAGISGRCVHCDHNGAGGAQFRHPSGAFAPPCEHPSAPREDQGVECQRCSSKGLRHPPSHRHECKEL